MEKRVSKLVGVLFSVAGVLTGTVARGDTALFGINGIAFHGATATDEGQMLRTSNGIWNNDTVSSRTIYAPLGEIVVGGTGVGPVTFTIYHYGNGITASCTVYATGMSSNTPVFQSTTEQVAQNGWYSRDVVLSGLSTNLRYSVEIGCALPPKNSFWSGIFYVYQQ